MVRLGRGRTVVGGVREQVVGLLTVLGVPVVATMEPVRHVAGRAGRRVFAEEVTEQPPEPVHRKGL